jgi:hypothetical protein
LNNKINSIYLKKKYQNSIAVKYGIFVKTLWIKGDAK